MPKRCVGQLNFMDAALSQRAQGRVSSLSEILRLVDWAGFERLLRAIPIAKKGEPSYPPLVMFKVLLLQRWHGLSDPAMEAALSDRLSFMAFAGLSLSDPTPDHATIWRFREKLGTLALIEPLLTEMNRQLNAAGLVMKQGTLIDASLVSSAARRPRMDEGKMSKIDKEARFGPPHRSGRFAFGYKLHVAVDAGSGLVLDMSVTPANEQDVAVAPQLLDRAAGTVYADRGYDSDPLRRELTARGLSGGLTRRRTGRDLTPAEVARNHKLSLSRRAVESLFGTMKRSYRLARLRAFTRLRNTTDLAFFCLAFNLRRWRMLTTTP